MVVCLSIFDILDCSDEVDSGGLKIERVKGKIEFDNVIFIYLGKYILVLMEVLFKVELG